MTAQPSREGQEPLPPKLREQVTGRRCAAFHPKEHKGAQWSILRISCSLFVIIKQALPRQKGPKAYFGMCPRRAVGRTSTSLDQVPGGSSRQVRGYGGWQRLETLFRKLRVSPCWDSGCHPETGAGRGGSRLELPTMQSLCCGSPPHRPLRFWGYLRKQCPL